jgi:uncharacterized membrane protein HdeD (DUF308 family)
MQNLFSGKQKAVLFIGIVVIAIGYILLAQGPVDNPLSLSFAPFLLIGGYCVIIPIALLLKDKDTASDTTKKKGV